MQKQIENAKAGLRKLIKTGFFHVVGAGTINKIVSLCNSIFIARVLSKDDFGMYGYVINIVNIFMLANGLGTTTGMLQFGCIAGDDISKKNAYFKFGMGIGLSANLLLSVVLLFYSVLFPETIDGSAPYLILASAIPLFSYVESSIPTYLKTENDNKNYGRLSSISSVFLLVSMLLGAYLFRVSGVLGARYVAYSATIVIGLVMSPNYRGILHKNIGKLKVNEKKQFVKFSLISCVNNLFAHILYTIDIYVIGIVIGTTSSIASYKVATTIPFALSFISQAVITYIYPAFVKNRNDNKWLRKSYKKLIVILSILNGVIAIGCYVLAPFIIRIIYGDKYLEAVECFRILIVGFWVSSSFRIPGGNVLDMLLKVRANLVISILSGVFNIIFDIILIKKMGSVGAAIATTSIYILTGILSNIVLYMTIKKKRNENSNS